MSREQMLFILSAMHATCAAQQAQIETLIAELEDEDYPEGDAVCPECGGDDLADVGVMGDEPGKLQCVGEYGCGKVFYPGQPDNVKE